MSDAQNRPGDPATSRRPIFELIEIMARLRSPDGGCPWDLEQTFATIAPYTIEEAYEVADAIERGDLGELKDELGDLLLQVVFHARIAEELGAFDFDAVAAAINDKMVRRHPHVFGDVVHRDVAEQTVAWETIKAGERAARRASAPTSLLDDVPSALPALTRAVKLSKRAARVGFVWPSAKEVLAKLHEEIGELEAEIAAGETDKAREELGDVLFVCANLARELDVDPESALRGANAKFVRRFKYIEAKLAERGSSPEASDLAEMDALWDQAKAAERVVEQTTGHPPTPAHPGESRDPGKPRPKGVTA
ncbi:MAG: nucleoside triphosphate pyrophosphohydrolase [Caulobacterales bacterium]